MKKAFKISAIVLVTLALIVIAVGTFVVNAAPTGVTGTNYQEIMQTSGEYELTENIVGQGDAKIRIGTNVTLDLKGHTITTTSASGLFYMLDSTPGTFTIKDSVGGGAIIVETADAPLFEKAGSTVYITGGTIVADRISAEGTNPDLHVIITGVGEAGDGSNVGTWTKFDPSKALGTGYTSIPEASPVDADAVNRVIPMEYTITLGSAIAGATYGGDNTKPLPYTLTYRTGDPDFTLSDAVATGYTFTGWYDDNGNKITAIATGSLLNLDLTARFELTDYTINYNLPAGAVNSATNPSTFTVQTPTITLGEPTLMGATFNGWYADATHTTPITEIDCATTPNNVDVYPSFTFVDYNINYILDPGATNNGANPGTYTVQDTVTFADPVKKGYTFIGWFDAEEGGNKITGIPAGTLASDITVYGRFEITVYDITYNVPEGAQLPEGNPTTYTILDNVTFAAPSMVGSTFVAWEGTTADGTVINNNQLLAGTTGDLELTAKWTLRNYRIEYILNDTAAFPVTNNPNQHILSYTMEDEIVLEPAVRTHYDFVGWYDAQEGGNKVEMIEEGTTGDIKLYARWTPTDYTITYDLGQDVTDAVMPEEYPTTYNVETAVTFPVPTRVGFDFLGWDCDGTIVTEFAAGSMYGNKTLVATWRVAQYNVNVIYKLTDEYVAQNGISAADAILYTEPVTLIYNTQFTHTVNFANSKYNGFVPDQWVVDMIVPLDQGDIIVYFSPVVVSTVYEDGEIVITYKDGTTNKIEISSIAGISLEGNALVYTLADGEKVTVASIATSTDLDAVKESVDDLNESLADLKTALENKDTQLAANIKTNADAIKANADAIKKNAADILANSGKIATNAEDIKANADAIAALEAAVATINEKIGDIESNVDSLSGTDTGLVVGVIIIAVVLAGVAGCVVFLFIKQRKA